MGTAAWGGCGEGKCFRCNGLSWCGCHLQCPSLLHQTAVPPKLLGVSIIRLCGRTAQPSATPASPPVSMRGMINQALHSASPKETSRWCAATQLREAQLNLAWAWSVSLPRIVGRSTFAEMLQMPGVSVVLGPVFLMVASQSQETQSAQTTLTVSVETRLPPAFAADGQLCATRVLGSAILQKTAVSWTNATTRSVVAMAIFASTSVTVKVIALRMVTLAPSPRDTLVLANNPFVRMRETLYQLTLSKYLVHIK